MKYGKANISGLISFYSCQNIIMITLSSLFKRPYWRRPFSFLNQTKQEEEIAINGSYIALVQFGPLFIDLCLSYLFVFVAQNISYLS